MAKVVQLFVAPARRKAMRAVEAVRAIADRGFEGCVHGRPGSKRQVLLVEAEVLEDFGLEPGVVRENVTTRGIRLAHLGCGERVRVGEALLEVTVECEPCERMDEIRMGLQEELRGQRGILCRVVEGGWIRRGDGIADMSEAVAARETGGKL